MTAPVFNSTPVTPPRVPLIDPRTGQIDRAWFFYLFSLFETTQATADLLALILTATDAASAVASCEAKLDELRQAVSATPTADTSGLLQQIDALRQELQVLPRSELGTMAALQQANVPWLTFDTTPEAVPVDTGTVYWTDDDATLELQLEGNTTYQFGQQLDFHPKNTSGSIIYKGMAVMATGVVGSSTKITCARAVADGSVLAQYMLGIATQDIAVNGFGYVAWFGSVRGFDTTGANKTVPEVWADGDILYFDPNYPGELTKVEPSAPDLDLPIAIVTNAANNGAIFVRMKTGESLNELHDINLTLPIADKSLLQYDSTAGYWKNITHFFLDAANKRMGINVPLPSTTLVVNANTSTTPPTPLAGTVADFHGANGAANRLALNAYAGAPVLTFVRANNTMASPTALASGDVLAGVVGTGYNGSAYTTAKISILFYAAEAWTTTANGTDLRLTTTPLGATLPEERFRIGPAGQFGITGSGVPDYGTSGYVFTSGGASAQPQWAPPQVSLSANNAFTGANTFYNNTGQTFGTATSTQDGIIIAGRAGGASSYRATIQPATLSANRTVTVPDETFTIGFRNLPPVGTQTGSYTLGVNDVGKYVQVSTGGSITIPTSTFAEGDAITIYNNTTGNITITCSAPTAYIAGTNTIKTSMTLATRGVATILFISSTLCVVTGNVT